jgi:hypothetical protein
MMFKPFDTRLWAYLSILMGVPTVLLGTLGLFANMADRAGVIWSGFFIVFGLPAAVVGLAVGAIVAKVSADERNRSRGLRGAILCGFGAILMAMPLIRDLIWQWSR